MIVFSASLIFLSSARTYENAERPETTYSEQEKTWNELQRARNDLQPEPTNKKKTWNNLQQVDFEIVLQFGAITWFSTQHLIAIIRALLQGESWWK